MSGRLISPLRRPSATSAGAVSAVSCLGDARHIEIVNQARRLPGLPVKHAQAQSI
jgi:hypothetical protein